MLRLLALFFAVTLASACSVYLDESLLTHGDQDGGGASAASDADGGAIGAGGSSGIPLSSTITMQSLTPSSVQVGAGDTALRVTGLGFDNSCRIHFNGVELETTLANSAELDATIPASLLAAPGTFSVTVQTVPPDVTQSTPLNFTVANVTPTLTAVSPNALTALAADTIVTLTGSGFAPKNTVAQCNGVELATTVVSSTRLTAVVPHSALGAPGTLHLRVVNAPPGGGASAPLDISVTCDGSGVDLPLAATGQPTSRATSLVTQLPAFKDQTTCPAGIFAGLNEGSQGLVVQNQTAAAAVLSAWAVCGSTKNDAFLTFYRRATAPASATDLAACTPTVSEGKSGAGGFASPESNGAQWCPGLTKANGQALAIGVCEKVVVFLQEYDVGLGPGTLKVQLDPP